MKKLLLALAACFAVLGGCLTQDAGTSAAAREEQPLPIVLPSRFTGSLAFQYVVTGPDNELSLNGTCESDAFGLVLFNDDFRYHGIVGPHEANVVSSAPDPRASFHFSAEGCGSVSIKLDETLFVKPLTAVVLAATYDGSGSAKAAFLGADYRLNSTMVSGSARFYGPQAWSGERYSFARIPPQAAQFEVARDRRVDWKTELGTLALFSTGLGNARVDRWTLSSPNETKAIDRLSGPLGPIYAGPRDDGSGSARHFILASDEKEWTLEVEHRIVAGTTFEALLVADLPPVLWHGTTLR